MRVRVRVPISMLWRRSCCREDVRTHLRSYVRACVHSILTHEDVCTKHKQPPNWCCFIFEHHTSVAMRRLLPLLQLVVAPCGLTTAWCVHHDHFHFANMKYHFQKARHFAKELPVTRLNVQGELNVAMRHLVALETEMEGGMALFHVLPLMFLCWDWRPHRVLQRWDTTLRLCQAQLVDGTL